MSKYNLIAFAIAAALAASTANAVEVKATTPDVFPTNALTATSSVKNTTAITVLATASDIYLGRTTGYNVKVDLLNGAKFKTASVAVPTGVGTAGATISIAGGGTVGSSTITYAVTPPASGVIAGDGISIPANAFDIEGLSGLAAGGTLNIAVRVGDPVGGAQLAATATGGVAIASAKEGWTASFAAPATNTVRIDVGSNSAKKKFSVSGVVNATGLDSVLLYTPGSVSVGIAPLAPAAGGLTSVLTLDESLAKAPLVITGEDFSAFKAAGGSISLRTLATCVATPATDIAATIAADGLSASIPATTTVDALQAAPNLCFITAGAVELNDQNINASLSVAQTGLTSSATFTDSTGKLLDMIYNGAVENVYHVNPGSNTAQISYLRIINTSTTGGLFTLKGRCDDATLLPQVTFNLAANKAALFTAQEMQTGVNNDGIAMTGAMGACTKGKTQIQITGEVGTMEVQNFLRNVTADGQINVNVNNQD